MRSDTYNASSYLVWNLKYSGIVRRVIEDGGDIVWLELHTGQQIMIYLIEQEITLSEIRDTITRNHSRNIYSLFTFWCDLLLPRENQKYKTDDWMDGLLSLYGDKLYGFEVAGKHVFFFPVYFTGGGRERFISYGPTIEFNKLHGYDISSLNPYLSGTWRVASFDSVTGSQKTHTYAPIPQPTTPLAAAYNLLGLHPTAPQEIIKQTYRSLARQLHPDVNQADDAHDQMQKLNAAYALIIEHLTGTP